MANFRPAGLSDDDTDSDDYGFFEKMVMQLCFQNIHSLTYIIVLILHSQLYFTYNEYHIQSYNARNSFTIISEPHQKLCNRI